MLDKKKGRALMAHIDSLLNGLQQVRSEVSDWLDDLESSESAGAVSVSETLSGRPASTPHMIGTQPIEASPTPAVPNEASDTADTHGMEFNLSEDDNIVFVPKKKMTLEKSFEPHLHFHPRRAFSLADTFMYANELCWGNRAEFDTILDEIERMSSWSQLENYIYTVLRLDPESESVQRFMDEVRATASTAKS